MEVPLMSRKLLATLLVIHVTFGCFHPVFAQSQKRGGENNSLAPSLREPKGKIPRQDSPAPEVEGPGSTELVPPVTQDPEIDFDALSRDLAFMEELFKGGNGQPVTFDSEGARLRGYSAMSIKLAEELTAYTNDLIRAASEALKAKKQPRLQELGVDINDYPLLPLYLEKATEHNLKEHSRSKTKAVSKSTPLYVISEYYCGSFWRPLPSWQATWKRHLNVSNPAGTLRAWGYHETPSWAGGGWTRAQTHMWWICGWNTYRDHAYPSGPTIIYEQNYSGRTPRGEPNPEFWRSGPWPYPTWPAYVAWWHQWGPGR